MLILKITLEKNLNLLLLHWMRFGENSQIEVRTFRKGDEKLAKKCLCK